MPVYAQNCLNSSTGLIPITDLGSGTYQGYKGGLYFGSNTKPAQQINNLNSANLNIKPLNSFGIADSSTNGKIVLLSIGASNPKTEFQSFQTITDSFSLINPFLKIVNGCQGGKGLQKIIDTTDSYWRNVTNQLNTNGVNAKQVQIVWIEEENTQSNNTSFPGAPLELMTDFKSLFTILIKFYPNLQICYVTARGYAGYVDAASSAGNGLRHPRDYFNGWALKWLIENQITGDASLAFTGPNKKAPVLDWGAYLWTDGKNQRQDGLNWVCPTDLKIDDGLHWSDIGNEKAGREIFKKFYLDEDARKWFLNNKNTVSPQNPTTATVSAYPNPGNTYFHIKTDIIDNFDAYIYNNMGKLIKVERQLKNQDIIKHNLPNGIYYLQLKTKNSTKVEATKFSVLN